MQKDEVLYWSRYNNAISNFCLKQMCTIPPTEEVICSLVGDELEWCGTHSFLFAAKRMIEAECIVTEIEARCTAAEATLKSEKATITHLKRIMKQNSRDAEDSEWQLQEQLAHSNSIILQEKEKTEKIHVELMDCQNKLIEVESFLSSGEGKLALALEEDLATCRLRIAELEADKDQLELDISKRDRKPRS